MQTKDRFLTKCRLRTNESSLQSIGRPFHKRHETVVVSKLLLIMDSSEENKNPDEEAVIIDPITLKPDLYSAAVANDTSKVVSLLQQQVPGTFIDAASGWTVRTRSVDDCPFD